MSWTCSSCGHQNLGRHKTCLGCGDPKDASEKFEMPADTRAAASVTDANLVRAARAGADWRCAYCGSDQRRLDDTCGRCGASIAEAVAPAAPRPRARPPWWQRARAWMRRHPVWTGAIAVVFVLGAIIAWRNRTRSYTAQVDAVRWAQIITVERYQVWAREGWRDAQPAAAFDVVSRGQQIHHYDDVLDGYDTEYYTEQVACGEDCYDEPQSCSEECTDNGNGFASCQTRCSGGGRRCSTRYCSESRSRQVPRYRKEPRYAEAIAYKIWDWGDHRTVQATGTSISDLRWPTEEARVGQGLGEREQERERRSAYYDVTLRYDGSDRLTFTVGVDELARFAVGSRHRLQLKRDRATVDGKPVQRAPRR